MVKRASIQGDKKGAQFNTDESTIREKKAADQFNEEVFEGQTPKGAASATNQLGWILVAQNSVGDSGKK